MKTIALPLMLSIAPLHSAIATGLHSCDSGDRSTWQTTEQLKNKLIDEGWIVRKIKEDGGCYEVYATTPEGKRAEAYFHPETLELELVARRGQILFKKTD